MVTKLHNAPIFSGRYDHALDGKNRVTIPARWRQTEADVFYLIPNPGNTHLIAMPPEEFQMMSEKVGEMAGVSAQERQMFIREFYSRARDVTVDKQGRMLLPEDYCQQIGLEKDTVILGAHKRFEIWNPKHRSDAAPTSAAIFDKIGHDLGL
jgi:MraZ protein